MNTYQLGWRQIKESNDLDWKKGDDTIAWRKLESACENLKNLRLGTEHIACNGCGEEHDPEDCSIGFNDPRDYDQEWKDAEVMADVI